jgi:nucleoside-triphosphatase
MSLRLLLTGRPGIGKTTVILRLAETLSDRAGGFYTQEVRVGGERRGFKIVTLDGREATLADVALPGRPRVGKYGLNLAGLREVGVAAIQAALHEKDYIVIDEIGFMELLSADFKEAVLAAFDSDKTVIATITERPHPWADQLKKRPSVELVVVTAANRDHLPAELAKKLA